MATHEFRVCLRCEPNSWIKIGDTSLTPCILASSREVTESGLHEFTSSMR